MPLVSGDGRSFLEALWMTPYDEVQATDPEKQQGQRRLAAELSAEFDIPFMTWEDFEQALAASGAKVRKV